MGWIVSDLNSGGAVGDASKGTAEKGVAVARHQADRFIQLLKDARDFDLSRFDRTLDTASAARAPLSAAV